MSFNKATAPRGTAQDPEIQTSEEQATEAQSCQGQTCESQTSANENPADGMNAPAEETAAQAAQEAPQAEESCQEKLAAVQDKYLRLQAEFDNYRKRTARERMDLVLTAGEEIIKGMLPVLDDCDHAVAAMEAMRAKEGVSEEVLQAHAQALEGIELIARKLFKYLETKGVKQIEAKGQALDTDLHAAIAQIPAPAPELKGKVVEVVQQGYTLNGKVIRFAQVVVGQ